MAGTEYDNDVRGPNSTVEDEAENVHRLLRNLGLDFEQQPLCQPGDGFTMYERQDFIQEESVVNLSSPDIASPGVSEEMRATVGARLKIVVDYRCEEKCATLGTKTPMSVFSRENPDNTANTAGYQLFTGTNPFGPQLLQNINNEGLMKPTPTRQRESSMSSSSTAEATSSSSYTKSSEEDNGWSSPESVSGGTSSSRTLMSTSDEYGRLRSRGSFGMATTRSHMKDFMTRYNLQEAQPRTRLPPHPRNHKFTNDFGKGDVFFHRRKSSGEIASLKLA